MKIDLYKTGWFFALKGRDLRAVTNFPLRKEQLGQVPHQAGYVAFNAYWFNSGSAAVSTSVGAISSTSSAPILTFGEPGASLTPSVGRISMTTDAAPMIPPQTLGLTGVAPTLTTGGGGVTISPTVGTLGLSGLGGILGLALKSSSAILSFSGIPGSLGLVVSPPQTSLGLAGASGRLTLSVASGSGAVILSGVVGGLGLALQSSAGTINLTGLPPNVAQPGGIAPTSAGIALVGGNSSLALRVTTSLGGLTLTGGAGVGTLTIRGSTGPLSMIGTAPQLLSAGSIAPPTGSGVLSGIVPTTLQASYRVPSIGDLTLEASGVTLNLNLVPEAATIFLTGLPPVFGGPKVLQPLTGEVDLFGSTPSSQNSVTVVSASSSIVTIGSAPRVSMGFVSTPSYLLPALSAISPLRSSPGYLVAASSEELLPAPSVSRYLLPEET